MFQENGGGDLTGLLRQVCTLRLISCLFITFPFTIWIMAHCGNLIFERNYVRECVTMFRTPKTIAEEFSGRTGTQQQDFGFAQCTFS